ncbi:hypothetical protein Esti_003522 [Eimeria stiedai]
MEVGEPTLPANVLQNGEQDGGKIAPMSQKASPTPFFASVLTKEQYGPLHSCGVFSKSYMFYVECVDSIVETVEATFSKGSQDSVNTIDADTATKLLVDLRPDVSQEQIDELMERFDVGFQGYLEKAQVLEAAEAQMYKAFRLFDRDDNGLISFDQLRAALQEGEDGLSNDELGSFLRLSACKKETCFDYRKFIDQVAYAPVVVSAANKKKKGKGKKQ